MPNYIDIYTQTESQASMEACAIPSNGTTGVGITSIVQTDATHAVVTLTNGQQYTLTLPTGPTGAAGAAGTNGTNGTNGAAGAQGIQGIQGISGTNGINGTNGTNGTNGINGINVRSGTGVPSNSIGADGDAYINYLTGDYYVRASGVYTKTGNISGPSTGNAGGELAGAYPNPTISKVNNISKDFYNPTSPIQDQIDNTLKISNTRNAANFGLTASLADVGHYNNPTGDQTYRVGGWINLLSNAGMAISLQVTYTDNHLNVKTKIFFPQGLTSSSLSIPDDYAFPPMDFRVAANTTIQVLTVVTGSGTILYEAGCTITKIQGD